MDASIFWEVIGLYNQKTIAIQLVLFAFLVCGVLVTVFTKKGWILKLILGVLNLFICIGFFAMYGVEPIQKYFAFPLYLFTGILLVAGIYGVILLVNEVKKCKVEM